MKFELKGHSGSGSAHVPINFDNLHWYDHTPLQFRTTVNPILTKPDLSDEGKRKKFELTWKHWIFYKGSELFEFYSYSTYYIDEISTPPTNEQLRDVIVAGHNHLRTSFEARRREFSIFEPIAEISEDTIQQTADQLHSFLLDPQ
jgi:hypothetical protein